MRIELDLTGLCCSVPQMLVYSNLKKMKEMDILEIVVEKGSSQERDVLEVLNYFGLEPQVSERNDGNVVYLVSKRRTF
ncbi:sulfurtransferase TusA family protein [Metallosphaera tengchongensis]|uniref:Sulfurtransferase TusA family protein n=1 Tax=Metallosphaera tengchongensis TaxID=1532350 RepID=A0A6N0NVP1_9CREN|nr:sulfurtransferase TusA family protein [Metallosphaera tengchongensis]QKR00802.1 sulfurtransferase TusA family protein [Metallosphaera tengchongensis]